MSRTFRNSTATFSTSRRGVHTFRRCDECQATGRLHHHWCSWNTLNWPVKVVTEAK